MHCGSTALANALRQRGLDLSEAMVFGLGAGLGFRCLENPNGSPSRLLLGRAAHLERQACEVLGAPVWERTANDAAGALSGARAALSRGMAPILSTELSKLPYWRARTPFGGHRVVLAGLDEERNLAFLADTHWPDLQEVALPDLDRARATMAPPLVVVGRPWLEVDAPRRPRPLAEAVRDALGRQVHDFLRGEGGMEALERFAAELPSFPEVLLDGADRQRVFRSAYQVIEVRGTGGGLFRRLYARFLREAEIVLPELSPLGLPSRMEELAAAWSRLARALRWLGEEGGREVPEEVVAQAHALSSGERRFFEHLEASLR